MESCYQRLRISAYIAIATHFSGGVSMLVILRHGLETNANFNDRLHFLVEHKTLWIAGWIPWSIAALSILFFYVCFARAHKNSTSLSRVIGPVAVLLSVVGAAFDLTAQWIEMTRIPDLALKALSDPFNMEFLSVHRKAMMFTGFTANGLYSLSALLLAGMTWSFYANWIRIAGLSVGILGLAASAAVFVNSVAGMFWANAILVPCILIWQAGVALQSRNAL
jgi:hypothetical protein